MCLPSTLTSLAVPQLAQAAHNDPKHVHGVSLPSGQHRSQQQHLEEHGALKLLRTAVCNPWLLYLCFMGVLLVSASNTYVFFLPMIINALLSGEFQVQSFVGMFGPFLACADVCGCRCFSCVSVPAGSGRHYPPTSLVPCAELQPGCLSAYLPTFLPCMCVCPG